MALGKADGAGAGAFTSGCAMDVKNNAGWCGRFALYGVIGIVVQAVAVLPAGAQQDTTKHKMTPGMKMPAAQTKAGATSTKTKAATSTKTKTAATSTKTK